MGVDGDSRPSDVPALYARPTSRIAAPAHGATRLVEQVDDPRDDIAGHVPVDVVRELDEAEPVAELPFDAPREERRVDGQAVAADAGSRGEAHVSERLRRGGVDRGPDVDSQLASEHRELVDERDVHVAKRVLEQLHQLGFAGRRHRHGLLDERAVEPLDHRARELVDARDDLRRVHERPLAIAGIDALGRVAEKEVDAGAEAARPRGSAATAPRWSRDTSSTRAPRARRVEARAGRHGRQLR